MAQIRYFKATNGRFTVFRASPTRVYLSAWIQSDAKRVTDFGFSMLSAKGRVPAEEMTKDEYEALVKRKTARIEARKAEIVASGGQISRSFGSSPSDSWVANLPASR
jgi:hypothetical protein